MGLMKKTALAFLAAALLPACLMALWYLYGQFQVFAPDDPYIWVRTRGWLLMCLMVSGAYVLALGLPAFLILKKLQAVRWWSTVGVGFVLGAIPPAVLAWPLRYPELRTSASVDGVQTMINGIPTLAGWLQYLSAVSFIGACGAVGALAFWLVWRHEPQPTVQADGPASGGPSA